MPARGARASALLANGGRVLNVTARGKTVAEAQARAYAADRHDRLAGRLLPPRHRLARRRSAKSERLSVADALAPSSDSDNLFAAKLRLTQ